MNTNEKKLVETNLKNIEDEISIQSKLEKDDEINIKAKLKNLSKNLIRPKLEENNRFIFDPKKLIKSKIVIFNISYKEFNTKIIQIEFGSGDNKAKLAKPIGKIVSKDNELNI
ncbi:3702_t:CDS:2 [Gigaspora margarita]|uniref:3702_t:CDS:1 n=1 Tax=Gigaspora margarita TaxID=4874 RepID=A0ABN7VP01_GIGMA|nr:3702_t:CDS:2 [Gigaspora margarita]